MLLSLVEENYLKTIYHLGDSGKKPVSTNALAENMNNKAASVTDMVKKLSGKGVITYEKYHGVRISETGKMEALKVIRKHRLWETFLVEKLDFNWDEVHEVAEQLEHIKSPLLIQKLDAYLGHPTIDPHGHPIPDSEGKIQEIKQSQLSEFTLLKKCYVQAVRGGTPAFLKYLSKIGIYIGVPITVVDKIEFDGSLEIVIDNNQPLFISREAAENLLVSEQSNEK